MTTKPLVKICGITRKEDALLAAELGCSFIGFIFAPSPRQISIASAREIREALPPNTQSIGVFRNASFIEILNVVDQVGLAGVQFHGDESIEFMKNVKCARPHLVIIKTIEVNQEPISGSIFDPIFGPTFSLSEQDMNVCDFLLFDSPRAALAENGSVAIRQKLNPIPIQNLNLKGRQQAFFIAGALSSQNIGAYLDVLQPTGVDISSGVEIQPGIKCHQALREFFQCLEPK